MSRRFSVLLALIPLALGCNPRFAQNDGKLLEREVGRQAFSDPPVGSRCRLDLVQPPKRGKAYEGRVVRVTPDEVVMVDVVEEVREFERGVFMGQQIPFARKIVGPSATSERSSHGKKEIHVPKREISNLKVMGQPAVAETAKAGATAAGTPGAAPLPIEGVPPATGVSPGVAGLPGEAGVYRR
jgi:hypothetical protein